LLLDMGADIDGTDRWGRTALHKAVAQAHPTTVRLLIDRGAYIEVKASKGREGKTLRDMLGAARGMKNAKEVQQILDALSKRGTMVSC
jgi:ankyrin repeat protein